MNYAVERRRGILDVYARMLGPEHRNRLTCASNMDGSLTQLGECAEAAVLFRTTLAVRPRALGVDDDRTVSTEGHFVNALFSLEGHVEAEALGQPRSLRSDACTAGTTARCLPRPALT